MLKAKTMSRLLIAASKDKLDLVVHELYRHNIFHIEDFVENEDEGYEGFKIGMPLSGASEISSDLIKIRSIGSIFGVSEGASEPDKKSSSVQIAQRIEHELPEIEKEVSALVGEKNVLVVRVREYEQRLSEVRLFSLLPGDLSLYRDYDQCTVFSGHIPANVDLPVPNEKFFSDTISGNLIVAVVSQENADEAERFLMAAGFQSVAVPKEDGTAEERVNWYTQEITRLNSEMGQVDERIDAQKEKHAAFLVACDELLTAEVEKAEAPLRFATTEETFVAEGWIPSDKMESLIADIRFATGGKVFVTETEIDFEKDSVPVEYDNPDLLHPTELLMDVYSRPKYTEIDPTLFMSVVFPIFFGLILGDVGYGIILLAMSFGLRKFLTGDAGGQLLSTLRNASISSIIFGVLYSEFLGFALPWDALMFPRHLNIGGHGGGHAPAVVELMVLSAWIGIFHITLGRILGIINHSRQDHGAHRQKAILGNLGWVLTMWGILVMIWSMSALPLMPDFSGMAPVFAGLNMAGIVGGVIVLAGLVGIGQENALELLEIPTIVSHVLSYTRLLAVGLSSVAIAMVINYISIGLFIEPAMENLGIVSIIIIIFGIVVFIIGHLFNTVLGLLGGGLHSIRLHYVEFFTKFYRGGGKKYNPFGMKRKFTED